MTIKAQTERNPAEPVLVELRRDEAEWLLDFLLTWQKLNILGGGDATDSEGTIPAALRFALL